MTNKEKFEAVFGFKANPDRFTMCFIFEDCHQCPFYHEKNCHRASKEFWDMEYKEPTNETDKETD